MFVCSFYPEVPNGSDSESFRISFDVLVFLVRVCSCARKCPRPRFRVSPSLACSSARHCTCPRCRVSPSIICYPSSSSGLCVFSCAFGARAKPLHYIPELSVSRLISFCQSVGVRVLILPGSAPALDSESLRVSAVVVCLPAQGPCTRCRIFQSLVCSPCSSGSCVLVCPEVPSP